MSKDRFSLFFSKENFLLSTRKQGRKSKEIRKQGKGNKETRNNIYSDMRYFKKVNLYFWQTFFNYVTYCNGPKVGIKLLKISRVKTLFLVSLLFVAVINPYSVF